MRTLLALLAASFAVNSFAAGGPIDGIYSCSIIVSGYYDQEYVTINGQPNGSSIFAVAAVTSANTFYGYGIGTATTTSFTGNTMFGLPFNFTVNPANQSFSGTIGVDVYGQAVTASASCSKIF